MPSGNDITTKDQINAADLMTPEQRLDRIVEILANAVLRLMEPETAPKQQPIEAMPHEESASEADSHPYSLDSSPTGR